MLHWEVIPYDTATIYFVWNVIKRMSCGIRNVTILHFIDPALNPGTVAASMLRVIIDALIFGQV